MQIVIDIPDEVYETFGLEYREKNCISKHINDIILESFCNGTPLPEGHGRIGDLDQILIWMIYKNGIIDNLKCGEITPVFKDATIIEAESEEDDLDNLDSMLEHLWNDIADGESEE